MEADPIAQLVALVQGLGFGGGALATVWVGVQAWRIWTDRQEARRAPEPDRLEARISAVESQIGRMAESIERLADDTRETQRAVRDALATFSRGMDALSDIVGRHAREDRENHETLRSLMREAGHG